MIDSTIVDYFFFFFRIIKNYLHYSMLVEYIFLEQVDRVKNVIIGCIISYVICLYLSINNRIIIVSIIQTDDNAESGYVERSSWLLDQVLIGVCHEVRDRIQV